MFFLICAHPFNLRHLRINILPIRFTAAPRYLYLRAFRELCGSE